MEPRVLTESYLGVLTPLTTSTLKRESLLFDHLVVRRPDLYVHAIAQITDVATARDVDWLIERGIIVDVKELTWDHDVSAAIRKTFPSHIEPLRSLAERLDGFRPDEGLPDEFCRVVPQLTRVLELLARTDVTER